MNALTFAMYRGLTREVLSILSWLVAAVTAFYFTIYQRGLAEELAKQLSNPPQPIHVIIAQVAMGAAIFLVVLIIVRARRRRAGRSPPLKWKERCGP